MHLVSWGVIGLVVASMTGAVLSPPGAETLDAHLYLLVEQGANSPGDALSRQELHAGDTLHVSVTAPEDTYLTLLAYDGRDQLFVPNRLRNERRSPGARLWQTRLRVDGQPGREQLLALLARRPIDVDTLIAHANAAADRGARRHALSKEPGVMVLASQEYTHR